MATKICAVLTINPERLSQFRFGLGILSFLVKDVAEVAEAIGNNGAIAAELHLPDVERIPDQWLGSCVIPLLPSGNRQHEKRVGRGRIVNSDQLDTDVVRTFRQRFRLIV